VPVPRRYDRRPPERDQTRINDRIRVPEVRLVGDDGNQIGVVKTAEAIAYAQERDLDLVEVAPEARPPVCRVLDYSKFKYEQAQKQKAARKHQQQITIREIKFRPKIAQNDYDTKKGHVERFLRGKDKVKVTIMFRGREVTHPERGVALLNKLAEELAELVIVEQNPLQDGRNMTMMLAPSRAVLAADEQEHEHHDDEGDEHHGGKRVHKHDLHAEAHAAKTVEEAELEEEEEFDEDSEPAPITEIEPITVVAPEPVAEPVAEKPVIIPADVEETPSGRPAQKSHRNPKAIAAAAKRAALQAGVDAGTAAESAEAEPGSEAEPVTAPRAAKASKSAASEEPKAKASSSKGAAPAKPAATKPAATKPAATNPAATKPAATKPASPKPRAPKTNGSGPKTPANGSNGSTAAPKAKTAAKAD
jgi:translation initiation factor IF-3